MRFTVKSTTTLILASKSPRRIELMTLAGFDFLSVPAVKEEKITGGTSPSDAVKRGQYSLQSQIMTGMIT